MAGTKKCENNIKEFRLSRHLSQQQLATAINSTSVSISRWEGGSSPSHYFREQLVKYFGVENDQLFPTRPLLRAVDIHEAVDSAGKPSGVIQIMETLLRSRRESRQAGEEDRKGIQAVKQADSEIDPDIQISREMPEMELEYQRRQLEREDQRKEVEHTSFLFEQALGMAEKFIALVPDADEATKTELRYKLLALQLTHGGHGESEGDILPFLRKKKGG